jgi:hypothetical protein
MAVDLALVADVLPDSASVAKDLGAMNIAGALRFSIGPALAPMVLAADGASYAFLPAVADACALARCFADNEDPWRLLERLGMRRELHAVREFLHRSGSGSTSTATPCSRASGREGP